MLIDENADLSLEKTKAVYARGVTTGYAPMFQLSVADVCRGAVAAD